MTSENTEEPTREPDTKGSAVSQTSPEDVNTSELELLDATPTPVVVPFQTNGPIPPPPAPAGAGTKRPPPLPPRASPPPPPRTTQAHPLVPPPPPGAAIEDAGTPLPSSSSGEAAPTAPSTAPRAKEISPAARPSTSPDTRPAPVRASQVRPSVSPPPPPPPRRSPSPEDAAASPPPPAMPVLGIHTVPLPAVSPQAPRPAENERFSSDASIADARKRVEHAASGDRTALARARTELGLLLEVAGGDATGALTEYRAAHGIAAHLLAPISAARRLTPLRPAAPALALLEAEVRATSDAGTRATRELELGMLLASSGAPPDRACQAFREVLAVRPSHPGALRGLETALSPAPRTVETAHQTEALAAHLETMAAVFRADTRLSAWIEVERGQLLEKLGRADAARAAFEAALALDGRIGPVRDAYTRHLMLQGHIEALVRAWAAEAALETDAARAARLLYFAGRLAAERLDQKPQAIELFERAAGMDEAAPSIRRAALRELLPLYEAVGNLALAAATGNKVLAFARESERAYWHRRLVAICEGLGRHADMAAHAHQVLTAEPDDEPMREKLDRALAALGQHPERVAMLVEQSSHASTETARIELLLQAAQVAERDMGRPDLALATLRSAWAIDPSSAETCDTIVRLLTPGTPPAPTDPDDPSRVRARIDFYIEAAASASDTARKIAHLEKLASIWEDEVRAPDRALLVYTEILAVEPKRRSAILGLARCAGRAGNAKELLRALVLEADQAGDDIFLERSLLLRAAEVASKQLGEPDAALDLVKRLLNRTGGDPAALRASFRIHERAGRHAEALAQLRLLLGQAKKGPGNYALQAEIARFLEQRMHRAADALTAWREAHRTDPANPTPRAEIRRILLANGDYRAVAEELAALGVATTQSAERGELLLEAAEIYDDRLGDAERSIPLLADAHVCLPDEIAIVERLDRAYLRTNKRAERMALLHASESPHPRSQFALASLQAEERDPGKAFKRLADLSTSDVAGTAALRILEHAMRRAERWNDLATVLRKQVELFATPEAKLGSAFELLALEEYGEAHAPEGQASARDLFASLAPNDLLHQEILLRRSGIALSGPIPARILATSLGTLAAAETDALNAAALQVAAGLLVENGEEANYTAQKEALLAYAIALESWPDCVTAARGARRIALRIGETETFVQAAATLGGLEIDPAVRCERLLEAADGYRAKPEHAAEAFDCVCKALTEDPNSTRAADAVIVAVGQGLDAGKAGETLRTALDRALSPDQAARLGAALAHVAIGHLNDQTVALEALRRSRKRAPKHVGNLLVLADVCNAMGLHAEAVEAATAAMAVSRDPAERLRAGVTLAEVHVRAPAFRDTARREANDAEKLVEQAGAGSGDLIGRLGAVFRQLGDEASAERVLISALMLGGNDGAALANLVTMYGTGTEAGERIATALHKVMTHAESNGRPRRPEWLAALGKVEATMLGRQAEGLGLLREAVVMAPARVETYQALAEAHGSAHDEAAREIAAMLPAFGCASPTAAQIAELVSLLARESRQGQRQGIAEAADALLALINAPAGAAPARGRAQSLPMSAPSPLSLGHETMMSSLLHDSTQAALIDVAATLSETVSKLVRQEPEMLGVSSRDRLTSRASHPVRALADRVARAFGDLRFDLYLGVGMAGAGRVLAGDPPSLLLGTEFESLPENEQAAALARLLTYVALDIPWALELSADDTDGILFGALRAGLDLWGKGELSASAETNASQWRPRVAKAASRKVKRILEESAQRMRAQADSSAWRDAVRIVALRAAYVVTGDLSVAIGQASKLDSGLAGLHGPALASKLFAQPVSRELVVFALSDTATTLRKSAGTV